MHVWTRSLLLYRALNPTASVQRLLASRVFLTIEYALLSILVGRSLAPAIPIDLFVASMALFVASFAGLFGVGNTFANEWRQGAMTQLWLAPANRWLLMAERTLPHIGDGVLNGVLVLLTGLFFGSAVFVNPAVWLALIVASISCTAFGAAVATLTYWWDMSGSVRQLSFTLMLLFSGAMLPLDLLPGALRWLGGLLPLAHATGGLQRYLAGEPGFARGIGLELGYAVLAAVVALVASTAAERQVRAGRIPIR